MEKTLLLKRASAGAAALACATVILMSSLPGRLSAQAQTDDTTNKVALLAEGKKTFRFETFGDEDFWGGVLKLHQVIAGAKLGGVGQGLSPKTAAALGLKADIDALPDGLLPSHRELIGHHRGWFKGDDDDRAHAQREADRHDGAEAGDP